MKVFADFGVAQHLGGHAPKDPRLERSLFGTFNKRWNLLLSTASLSTWAACTTSLLSGALRAKLEQHRPDGLPSGFDVDAAEAALLRLTKERKSHTLQNLVKQNAQQLPSVGKLAAPESSDVALRHD